MLDHRALFRPLPLLLALAGCAAPFQEGVRQYDHGRYPEAAMALRRAEADARIWVPGEKARYALYRGLVHLALGDQVAARMWLGEAKRAFDLAPRVFSDEDGGKLASAWAHLPETPEVFGTR